MQDFIKEHLMVIGMVLIVLALSKVDASVPSQFNEWVRAMSFGF